MTKSGHHALKSREFYIDQSDNTMNFGDGDTKHGYSGFGFCLAFNEDGSFAGHGAFE